MPTYVAGAQMAREVLVVVFLVGKSLRGKKCPPLLTAGTGEKAKRKK